MATHAEALTAVDASGGVRALSADPRVRGATAVALVGRGLDRRAVVLGTGGYLEQRGEDAVVLALPFPEPR